jgi:hypothetical protein
VVMWGDGGWDLPRKLFTDTWRLQLLALVAKLSFLENVIRPAGYYEDRDYISQEEKKKIIRGEEICLLARTRADTSLQILHRYLHAYVLAHDF